MSVDLDLRVSQLIARFKQRIINCSFNAAHEVLLFIREAITKSRWNTAQELMDVIKKYKIILEKAAPYEMAIGNMIRRILFIIRDEYETEANHVSISLLDSSKTDSLVDRTQSLVCYFKVEKQNDYTNKTRSNFIPKVIESVNDLLEELNSSCHDIAAYSSGLIHAKEIILTYGFSHTVKEFFLSAAKSSKKNFHVVVVENYPEKRGTKLAAELSKEGIDVTLINDSAIFGVMSRVNKVIIGAHAIMADGGLMALTGTLAVANAAQYFSVPVIVCSAIYKLTPLFPTSDLTYLASLGSPNVTLSYTEVDDIKYVEVLNPLYDYVPHNLIELFITNYGGYSPSYIYRQLREYYHPDDILD